MALDRHLLTAFWIVSEGPSVSHRQLGVSAYSLEDAFHLLEEMGIRVNPATATIRSGIRVEDLDPAHILPNMGVIVRRGVWYPNLNASSLSF